MKMVFKPEIFTPTTSIHLSFVFSFRPKDLKLPKNFQFPGKGVIYDFFFDKSTFGTWHPWEKGVVIEEIPPSAKVCMCLLLCAHLLQLQWTASLVFVNWSLWPTEVIISFFFFWQPNELIIPTTETVRQRYFLELFLSQEKPLLLVGPTGTGKSAITNNYILRMPSAKWVDEPCRWIVSFFYFSPTSRAFEASLHRMTAFLSFPLMDHACR